MIYIWIEIIFIEGLPLKSQGKICLPSVQMVGSTPTVVKYMFHLTVSLCVI